MATQIKFFTRSYADVGGNAAYTIDNNSTSVENMFDRDNLTNYSSVGSDDTDTITLVIDLNDLITLENIIIVNNNLKEFTIEGQDSLDAWNTLASETTNSETVYNLIFTEADYKKIRITMTKTMVADDQKNIQEIYVCKSLGQLSGFPEVKFKKDKNAVTKRLINGRVKILYTKDSHDIELNFKGYMGSDDRDLFITLTNYPYPFLVWICGGDEDQFSNHADEGFREEDIYLCAVDKGFSNKYTDNYYKAGMNAKLRLVEVG
jgi:hypothetical protein